MAQLLIDGTALSRHNKGVGRYTFQLCQQVASRLPSTWKIAIAVFPQELPEFAKDFRASFVTLPTASNIVKGLIQMPRLAHRIGADVLLRPMESAGYDYHLPMITVCHDIPELIRRATRRPRDPWRTLVDGVNEHVNVHAMRKSVLVVCNSKFVRDAVTTRYKLPAARTALGHCGVDPRFYVESTFVQPEAVRRKYGVSRYLLTFATGDRREGFDLLPEIGQRLKQRGADTCLLVAGVRIREPYAEVLRQHFRALGLVEFRDFLFEEFLTEDRFSSLAELYTAADFYLELSRHEGFGMQLIEAMACGTTCISTGRGALREVAGKHAIEVKMDDVESIASAICSGYARGLHIRDNREQVEHTRQFNWDDVGVTVTRCIERVGPRI